MATMCVPEMTSAGQAGDSEQNFKRTKRYGVARFRLQSTVNHSNEYSKQKDADQYSSILCSVGTNFFEIALRPDEVATRHSYKEYEQIGGFTEGFQGDPCAVLHERRVDGGVNIDIALSDGYAPTPQFMWLSR